jgi:hypothetical protein
MRPKVDPFCKKIFEARPRSLNPGKRRERSQSGTGCEIPGVFIGFNPDGMIGLSLGF